MLSWYGHSYLEAERWVLKTFLGYMTALVNALKMTYVNFAAVISGGKLLPTKWGLSSSWPFFMRKILIEATVQCQEKRTSTMSQPWGVVSCSHLLWPLLMKHMAFKPKVIGTTKYSEEKPSRTPWFDRVARSVQRCCLHDTTPQSRLGKAGLIPRASQG